MNRKELAVSALMALFFLVGFAGHSLHSTLPWMIRLTPYTLVVFGLAAFLPVVLEGNKGLWLWSLAVFVVTFVLEALGTATGRIFGPYHYGDTLGLKLFGVPLVIAFNWLLVILGAVSLSGSLFQTGFPTALLAAVLAAGFDFLLEPTAIRLDYWSWHTAAIPLRNYLAWFLIALAASLHFLHFRLAVKSRLPMVYFLIQLAFFSALRLFPPGPLPAA